MNTKDCLLYSLTLLALGYSASQLIEPRKVSGQGVTCCNYTFECDSGLTCDEYTNCEKTGRACGINC